jgi:hypothetical protein
LVIQPPPTNLAILKKAHAGDVVTLRDGLQYRLMPLDEMQDENKCCEVCEAPGRRAGMCQFESVCLNKGVTIVRAGAAKVENHEIG